MASNTIPTVRLAEDQDDSTLSLTIDNVMRAFKRLNLGSLQGQMAFQAVSSEGVPTS
jgi:hypothetical protein